LKPRSSRGINDFDVVDHLIEVKEQYNGQFLTDSITYPAYGENKALGIDDAKGQSTLDTPWGMHLPGHGVPDPNCGVSVVRKCPSCGEIIVARRNCNMRECPHCHKAWASKSAERATRKLWHAYNYAKYVLRVPSKVRLLPFVVSLPHNGESIETMREMVYRIAKNHGFYGASWIPHPFRKDESDQFYVPDGYVHFHGVGIALGKILPGTDSELYGAVFSVIPDYQGKNAEKDDQGKAKRKTYHGMSPSRSYNVTYGTSILMLASRKGRTSSPGRVSSGIG
jgi:hypothetical protein